MRYYDRYLTRIPDTPLRTTYKTYETPIADPRQSQKPCPEVPTKPTKPDSVGFAGRPEEVSPAFATPWPPRPAELARWPIPWRERWGCRANELDLAGVPWPDHERQAFDEIRKGLAC
jgi:hypothetical protein